MQRNQFYYKIDNEDYIKSASAVFLAYRNARDLYEGINNSIIYHYYTHSKMSS